MLVSPYIVTYIHRSNLVVAMTLAFVTITITISLNDSSASQAEKISILITK